jgi:hypothetical protein
MSDASSTKCMSDTPWTRPWLEACSARPGTCLAVIKAIMPPRDPGIRSWRAYRGRFVEPRRIAAGHRFMHAHAAKLALAEARYGVPAEIIAAIIGVETIYGKHTGRFGSFAALTTLAFDYPPRADLFRRELEELLLLAREEGRSPTRLSRILCRRPGPAAIPAVFATAPWRRFRWRRPHRPGVQRRRCNRQRRQFSGQPRLGEGCPARGGRHGKRRRRPSAGR